MFMSKKIKLYYTINQYKQLCKSDGQHNLQHAYNFKYNFNSCFRVCCLNMHTKYSNKSPKKISKIKSASFSTRYLKISSPAKGKDVPPQKQRDTIINISNIPLPSVPRISDIPLPPPRSTTCTSHGIRKYNKSKESIKNEIKNDTERCESSGIRTNVGERSEPIITRPIEKLISTIDEQRINSINTVPLPTQGLITNYGFLNISSICCNPYGIGNLVGNPLYFQNDPISQVNHFNRNFMCRSDVTTPGNGSNSSDARDRSLLWEWRTWQRTQYGKHFDKHVHKHSCIFTVMSYNVLAQDLLTEHKYLYRNHKPDALIWEQRWKNIMFEIKQHNADILCLQEVQASHVETHYTRLKTLGYDGIYKQRTGNTTIDGCAIYYKSSTLKLVDYVTVEYNQPQIFVLNRDNVGIIAKFAPVQNLENEFVVATTHLLYNPRREDVRLAQVQVLLTEIDRMSYKRKNSREHYHLPIIMTGDFNFMPDTPVYKLITGGVLQYEHLTSKSLLHTHTNGTYENETGKYFLPASLGITDQCQHIDLVNKRNKNQVVKDHGYIYLYHSERSNSYNNSKIFDRALFSTGVISHHLALKSAFKHRHGNNVEATTFQNKWITVDYIFYSGVKDRNGLIIEDKLNLLSRYIIPTTEQLQGVTIPNMAVGSDHFSLIVKFELN